MLKLSQAERCAVEAQAKKCVAGRFQLREDDIAVMSLEWNARFRHYHVRMGFQKDGERCRAWGHVRTSERDGLRDLPVCLRRWPRQGPAMSRHSPFA